jgi:transposase
MEAVTGPRVRGEKNRVLDLYERCPESGAVVCFDECGPLELRPLPGRGWARVGHPQRFRATYRRLQGTEQLLAFYDVHADCLVGQVRKRKTVKDLLAVFARLRACYPMATRLYVVMDNLNTHKHVRLRTFMAAHNIEPVYTPTYASWLNAIEAHFGPLKKFAITGTDDPSHEYRRWRIARYLTWRNRTKGSYRAAIAKFSRTNLYRH